MLKKVVLPAVFALLLPILAGCVPVGARVSSAAAGMPNVQGDATADLTRAVGGVRRLAERANPQR